MSALAGENGKEGAEKIGKISEEWIFLSSLKILFFGGNSLGKIFWPVGVTLGNKTGFNL